MKYEEMVYVEETKVRHIAVILLLFLIGSLVSNYWQYRNQWNKIFDYRESVATLRKDNLTHETDIEMYLAYIQNLEERITPDVSLYQQDIIRRFILSYFTFSAGEEEARIDNSAEFVVDEILELMYEALIENPGGNYHLSLTASNIEVYSGDTNEFLATFNVDYESDITRSMTQVLVVRFVMEEDLIREFAIISASEVFNFD